MHEEIQERLKEQPAVFVYLVHASLYVTSMGLGSKDDDKINTSIEEYRAFFEKNKIRAPLFVDAFTCGTVPIDWEAPGNKDFCCWPQASLDTGTWAYYSVGGDIHSIGSVINELSEGKTVGDAVLTRPHYQIRTQGDILAHLPES
jgi:hypothetical protein